jgi:hypothetical protein
VKLRPSPCGPWPNGLKIAQWLPRYGKAACLSLLSSLPVPF